MRSSARASVVLAGCGSVMKQSAIRIVSVEMFEHMRNWVLLLARISTWLKDNGRVFIHIFTHRQYTYPFVTQGDDNWMGRHE